MSNDLWKDFQAWKKRNKQFGRQAFARFMMLTFLDGLKEVSSEFVFKGGNLLWHYIDTPRETTDLDLTTLTISSHDKVREHIERSFEVHSDVEYSIERFTEVDKKDGVGANVIVRFKTTRGQENQFQVDIVYALSTDLAKVKSTTSDSDYQAASIENIIADKMAAAHRFGLGNTRLKDFDDLWRISKSNIKIDRVKLGEIFNSRKLEFEIPLSWAETMRDAWKAHARRYKELPASIDDVFIDINSWLSLMGVHDRS